MEISAISPSPSFPPRPGFPSPLSPFSDQSHLQFYGPLFRREFPFPVSFFSRHSTRGLQAVAPVRFNKLFASPAVPTEVADERDFVKELADLKARLKQKKKEMKTQMKEMKKALKSQKQKASKSKVCSSSSSSESESSDRECKPAVMKPSQQEQVALTESGSMDLAPVSAIGKATQRSPSSDVLVSDCTESSIAAFPARSSTDRSCSSAKSFKAAGKVEVCVGESCKKAGSQQLLSSLRAQIPSDSAVEAVPCKCMGRCKMSINVRVQKEETNPLHNSHVVIQDAGLLLSHHFNLGHPPSGLPSLGSQAKPCLAPQRLTASL